MGNFFSFFYRLQERPDAGQAWPSLKPPKPLPQQTKGLTHMLSERCRVFHRSEVPAVLGLSNNRRWSKRASAQRRDRRSCSPGNMLTDAGMGMAVTGSCCCISLIPSPCGPRHPRPCVATRYPGNDVRLMIATSSRTPLLAAEVNRIGWEGGFTRVQSAILAGPERPSDPDALAHQFIDLVFAPHQLKALLGGYRLELVQAIPERVEWAVEKWCSPLVCWSECSGF